jgi:predicted Zn-dependent peptidase
MHPETTQSAHPQDAAQLLHTVIDAHDRSTRLYASVRRARHGLIDITLSSTFSGSSQPDRHRVLWQSSLPPQAILELREVLDTVLATAVVTSTPSDEVPS